MTLRSNRTPYTQNMKAVGAKVTAAKTIASATESAATNAVLLYTAPATAPAILTSLTAAPNATVTASMLKLYIAYAGSPTVLHRVKSALMPAFTIADTTADTPTDFGYSDTNKLKLSAGDALYVASSVALAAGIEFTGSVEEYEAVT
jgi:hypothetical protein